jgi:hypothetical protein
MAQFAVVMSSKVSTSALTQQLAAKTKARTVREMQDDLAACLILRRTL